MPNDLENKIISQIEHYFGDINMSRDKFLKAKIKENEGWVSLDVLLTFNRLAALSRNKEVIINAVEKSNSHLLEISEDREKLRRFVDKLVPDMSQNSRKLMLRTAYAKGFQLDEKFDDILRFFEQYGEIDLCLLRRKFEEGKKPYFKGSCYIIFKYDKDCKRFVNAESVMYKGMKLKLQMQKSHLLEKELQHQYFVKNHGIDYL